MGSTADNVTGRATRCQACPVDMTGNSEAGDVLIDLDVQLHAKQDTEWLQNLMNEKLAALANMLKEMRPKD